MIHGKRWHTQCKLLVMDDPVFLQSLDQGIYQDTAVKSIEQITNEYLGKNKRIINLSDLLHP